MGKLACVLHGTALKLDALRTSRVQPATNAPIRMVAVTQARDSHNVLPAHLDLLAPVAPRAARAPIMEREPTIYELHAKAVRLVLSRTLTVRAV